MEKVNHTGSGWGWVGLEVWCQICLPDRQTKQCLTPTSKHPNNKPKFHSTKVYPRGTNEFVGFTYKSWMRERPDVGAWVTLKQSHWKVCTQRG